MMSRILKFSRKFG